MDHKEEFARSEKIYGLMFLLVAFAMATALVLRWLRQG